MRGQVAEPHVVHHSVVGGGAINGVCSSVGRALGCDPGGRGFDPHHTPQTCMGDSNGLGSGLQIRFMQVQILSHAPTWRGG